MFNGERLRIARQRRAMTKRSLAEAVGVSARAITGWEADDYPPEEEHLKKLTSILRFPVSFFLLDDPTGTDADAVSFRSLSRKSARQRDAVISMCDLAVDFMRWVEDRIVTLPKPSIPDMSGETPSAAATLLRQEWGLGSKPVKNMLHLLEAKGVRVLALAENCREIDACSFWSDELPFILLNTTVSSERMRFDMAHELAHLVLHQPQENVGRLAEREANEFASEFLMPQNSIVANRPKTPTLAALIGHKKHWNVSVAALAYRLHREGYISDWNFRSLNIEMNRRGYRQTEPNTATKETSFVFESVLARLREIGMPMTVIANGTAIPVEEISQMVNGIVADVSLHEFTAETGAKGRRSNHLRVVQ